MTPDLMPLILDLVFVLIAVIFIAIGVKRGFIKSLIQSAKFLLAIVVTYFVGPMVSGFIKDKFIFQPIYDWLTEAGTNVVSTLPKFLQPEEGVVGQEVLPIANSISGVISNVIGYIVTFVLALILLTLVAWLLTALTDRINFLGTANRILGGVFGAAMGLVVLFIIAVIIKFLDAEGAIYPNTTLIKLLGNIAP